MTDLGPFCGKSGGRCIVGQLDRALEQLRTSVAPDERREAMMWIVHLVGDIHQPLHCSTDGDRGGNEKWVRVTYKSPGGAKIKLHALWDHLMRLSDSENSASELANSLRLTPKQADTMGLVVLDQELLDGPCAPRKELRTISRSSAHPARYFGSASSARSLGSQGRSLRTSTVSRMNSPRFTLQPSTTARRPRTASTTTTERPQR
jgi:hypothetical protein